MRNYKGVVPDITNSRPLPLPSIIGPLIPPESTRWQPDWVYWDIGHGELRDIDLPGFKESQREMSYS